MRIAFAIFFLLGMSGCTFGPNLISKGPSGPLFLFYNNDNISYVEPCGCRVTPIGGMDRRWNAMERFPKPQRLFVDAGNLLFKSAVAAEHLKLQWYEQAVGVIEGYNILAADAVTPGETDFALGVDKFLELAGKAKFPFVSANIYVKKTGKLLLKDSILVERGGRKIGIFGVFRPSLSLPAELEARDSLVAAKQAVARLKKQGADLVVALSHQGYDSDLVLAKEVAGIDVIVGAVSQSLLQNPVVENGVQIVQLSSQGQMLGYLEFGEKNKVVSSVVAELNSEYDNAPEGKSNPMKSLLAVTNLRIAEANRKFDEELWKKHQAAASGFDTFISCRECHTNQTKFQEGTRHAAAFLTLVARHKEENLDCVKCHSVGLGVPGGFTGMADAFRDKNGAALPWQKVRKDAGWNNFPAAGTDYRKHPEKIKPDVAQMITSLKRAGVAKSFVTVQCENCHGAMAGHPFAEGVVPGAVTKDRCLQCHTQAQMPAWYDGKGVLKTSVVDEAIKQVGCPREQ